MLKISKIDQEIAKILAALKQDRESDPLAKLKGDSKSKFELLKSCRLYLKTEPREKFVRKQLQIVSSRLEAIERNYPAWLLCDPERKKLKNPMAAYNTEFEKSKLMLQHRALETILEIKEL